MMLLSNHALVSSSVEREGSVTRPPHLATTDEIAALAHFYWEQRVRNGNAGSADEDWHRAVRALTQYADGGDLYRLGELANGR